MQGQDVGLSTSEAAARLGVSAQRVRKLVQEGRLAAVRDDKGHWRISKQDVEARLRQRRQAQGGRVPQDLSGLVEALREERDRLARHLEEERADRRRLQDELALARRAVWQKLMAESA